MKTTLWYTKECSPDWSSQYKIWQSVIPLSQGYDNNALDGQGEAQPKKRPANLEDLVFPQTQPPQPQPLKMMMEVIILGVQNKQTERKWKLISGTLWSCLVCGSSQSATTPDSSHTLHANKAPCLCLHAFPRYFMEITRQAEDPQSSSSQQWLLSINWM